MNVKLKKVLCVVLTLLLSVNTLFSCVVYAGDLAVVPTPTPAGGMPWWDDDDWKAYEQMQAYKPAGSEFTEWLMTAVTGSDVASKELGKTIADKLGTLLHDLADNGDMKTDGDNIYISQNGVDQINDTVQNSVRAFDGYYLFDSSGALNMENVTSYLLEYSGVDITKYSAASLEKIQDTVSKVPFIVFSKDSCFGSKNVFFYNKDTLSNYDLEKCYMYCYDSSNHLNIYSAEKNGYFSPAEYIYRTTWDISGGYISTMTSISLNALQDHNIAVLGMPLKVFYSEQDVINYLNKGRTYAPKLPSQIIRIPTKVINNTPNITYNITTENKTENNVQNEYNQILYDYITNLYPSSGNPTPTPTPIISDGEPTPTPTPDWGDGSLTPTPTPVPGADMTETNDWLKKIYELLEKFYNAYQEFTDKLSDYLDNNDAFFKKVSEYLDKHDEKLDQIIDALDKIAQGKDEGDEKGCKYDYKELSEFLTKLWNDSDKKFDNMIDLLEENNEYQEKMLSTLNSIKNILRAESVMDTFKNRSKETANKAKEKFPTSVPWDIAMIVNAMDAEPEDPVFLLPIKIERLGIDEEIKVDLSTCEWEKLAKACRYMLTLLFILFMIRLSMKLFSGKDDD